MELNDAVQTLTALAHEGRLEIFRLLVRRAPDEVAAGEIALALGVRGSTLSNQLNELERAGMIASRRNGRSVLYWANLEAAGRLLGFLANDCCKNRPETCQPIADTFLRRSKDWGVNVQKGDETAHIYNVLFLCVGNSARSVFAEAVLTRVGLGKFKAFSAGSEPRGEIHPRTEKLLRHLNYVVSGFRSKSWDEFAVKGAPKLDFVITVCDKAANETCPLWPGQPMSAHWGIPDPAEAVGSDTEIGLAFTEAYRQLFNRISAFTNLPIHSLDSLKLQKHLDAIGNSAPSADDQSALERTA